MKKKTLMPQNSVEFQTAWKFGLTRTLVRRFEPNFGPSESWIVYQNRTTNSPKPSQNFELQTRKIGVAHSQHYFKKYMC